MRFGTPLMGLGVRMNRSDSKPVAALMLKEGDVVEVDIVDGRGPALKTPEAEAGRELKWRVLQS